MDPETRTQLETMANVAGEDEPHVFATFAAAHRNYPNTPDAELIGIVAETLWRERQHAALKRARESVGR